MPDPEARPLTRMRLAVAVAALVLGLSAAWAGRQPRVDGERLEFRLPDLAGNEVAFDDPRFAGKVLLIDLWGTWCPPCVSEIPTFSELQQRYGEEGLVIVAIAFEAEEDGETRREYLKAYGEENGIDYLVLDGGPPEEFRDTFPTVQNVRGFPIEILVGRDGRIADTRNSYGYSKRWVKKLTRDLEALLQAASPR